MKEECSLPAQKPGHEHSEDQWWAGMKRAGELRRREQLPALPLPEVQLLPGGWALPPPPPPSALTVSAQAPGCGFQGGYCGPSSTGLEGPGCLIQRQAFQILGGLWAPRRRGPTSELDQVRLGGNAAGWRPGCREAHLLMARLRTPTPSPPRTSLPAWGVSFPDQSGGAQPRCCCCK